MSNIRKKKQFTSVSEIIVNGINKENAVIRQWDRVYCELAKEILEKGEAYVSRAGEVAGSLFAPTFKLDVGKEFPVLESKKVILQNSITELLWIYQAQTNRIDWLHERENHIWDEWEIDANGDWHTIEYANVGGKVVEKEVVRHFGKEFAGTIGKAYGYEIAKHRQTDKNLHLLKTQPNNRRIIFSLWQNDDLAMGVLEPCVLWSHFIVKNGKLNLAVQQRSGDIPLGVPFNISQYAVLLSLFAKVTGYEIGELSWRIDDAHIYKDQLSGMKTQLMRYKKMQQLEEFIQKNDEMTIIREYDRYLKLYENMEIDNKEFDEIEEILTIFELMITKSKPELYVADKDDFYAFDNHKNNKDIYVKSYKSAPFIKFPISK